jgi:hypothetical protein
VVVSSVAAVIGSANGRNSDGRMNTRRTASQFLQGIAPLELAAGVLPACAVVVARKIYSEYI